MNKRIEEINSLLIDIASGNYGAKLNPSSKNDEIDAIITGINMLGDELQYSAVSRHYLNRIYQGIMDALVVLNPDYTISNVNSRTCKLLGYQEEELIGRHFADIIAKEDNSIFLNIVRELDEQGSCSEIEHRLLTKEGKHIEVSSTCSFLYSSQGDVNGVLYVGHDVTAIRKAEAMLKVKNDELNTFVYKASHDLKSPLASIMGLVNLAKNHADNKADYLTYINMIDDSIQRMDRILMDLLKFGRITYGRLEYAPIDFRELIDQIVKSIEHLPVFELMDISISIENQTELRSERELLRTILQNLIDNAIKYRDTRKKPSKVGVTVSDADNGVQIEVSDNGIGMSAQVQSDIFKMFYRGHEDSKGSGLGLFIVKASVAKLGGTISVKSKHGEGTTFIVFIPDTREEDEPLSN